MGSAPMPGRRLRPVGLCLLFVFFSVAVGTVAVAGQTPIDSGDDDTELEDDRIVPSEQLPFGIRTIYGSEDPPIPSGGDGVTVAVIDTGVDTDHPDLRDRVTLCRDFTGDRVRNRCQDENGHGTHVAGTIAADAGADDRGIYGVAPDADVYAFRACDDEGRCGADPLADAVRTATDEGADVVVLSLGGRSEPRVEGAVNYATERGTVVVAASGNSGPELESILYPAAHPNVIAVGAAGPLSETRVAPDNYQIPDFSSRGTDEPFSDERDGSLEVAAPGSRILSPLPGGDYGTKSGTSMAAPHVAGLAAKILAGSPSSMSVSELRAELRERAPRYDISAGRHSRAGYDPAAGFGIPTVSDPTAAFSVDPETPISDEPFMLNGTLSQSDTEILEHAWDTDGDGEFDRTGPSIELEKTPGTHPITLRVRDAENATATVTEEVFVNDRPRVTVNAPETALVDENVTFEATIENEFGETTLTWVFPDGSTETGERVTRSFETGNHSVGVTVVDEYGATSTGTATVSVSEPEPEPEPEDQGPVLSSVVLLAVVICTVLARRFR